MPIKKKSHTCREGGGMSQNFCLRFIDKLEKPPFVQKTFKVDQENYKNFNIYNVVFFKKEEHSEISSFYNCVAKILMI